MKKLMMLTVLAAMLGFALPDLSGQQPQTQPGTEQPGTQQQPGTTQPGTTQPGTQQQPGTQKQPTQPGTSTQQGMMGAQATFKEIEESDLPSAIRQAISTKYADNDVQKVYQGSDNMYRLELSGDKGEEANIIYFSRTGELVREETLQGKSM